MFFINISKEFISSGAIDVTLKIPQKLSGYPSLGEFFRVF